jgi:hypothetical protein
MRKEEKKVKKLHYFQIVQKCIEIELFSNFPSSLKYHLKKSTAKNMK